MKRFQPLVFSVALLLLAACSDDVRPADAAASGFSFSVDPAAGSVSLQRADAEALSALQLGACGEGEPRVLFAEEELALTAYNAVFLPGNFLEITAEFTNVTGFTFEQPFTFTQAESTSNIVSSQEPEVTDADLGGDGALSPDETTSTLTFTVEHRGQPFTYEVLAEAVVDCGDGDPTDPVDPVDPVDPTLADLAVTKTGDTEATFDDTGAATLNYSVVVTNNGSALAEGVELTDTLTIDLSAFPGITADVTAVNLPAGCVIDATAVDAEVVICTVGTLDAGGTTTLDFTFDVNLDGDLTTITGPIAVTNTADATTTTEEGDLTNNSAVVDTTLTAAPVAALADLSVAKTGDTTVTTDADGNATLNYTVVVTNNGDAIAEGTELTDTFTIDLTGFAGDAVLTASVLPDACTFDAELTTDDVVVATCALGALDAGGSSTLDFTFNVDLPADVPAGSSFPVTNTADASTSTEEGDLTNNSALVESTVTVPTPL